MTDNEPTFPNPWVAPLQVPAPTVPPRPANSDGDDGAQLLDDAGTGAADVRAARALLDRLLTRRDVRIRRALEAGYSARTIAYQTALTPNQIGRIRVGQTTGRSS